jgi:hypothetical protein
MTQPARPRRNRSRPAGVPSLVFARALATLHTPFLPVLSKREMARLIRALYGVMANAEKSVRGGKGR